MTGDAAVQGDGADRPDTSGTRDGEGPTVPDRVRLAQILDGIADGFYAVDNDLRFTFVNREAERLWGKRREDLIGKNLWDEFPGAVNTEGYRQVTRAAKERCPVAFETVSPVLGVWLDVSVYPHDGGLSIFFRDVSERKLADEERERLLERQREIAAEAERSRAQLEAVFQSVSEGIMVFDTEGNAVLVNEAEARMLGFATVEEMKRDLSFFGERYELFDSEGSPVPVEDWPASRVLRGESIRDLELRGRTRESGREWFFSFSGQPVRDESGDQVLAVLKTSDVTERKRLEEQFLRAQRMESIGALAGGIAHDLNNILSPLVMSIDVLRHRIADEGSKQWLDAMRESANRGADLVKQVLSFARGIRPRREAVRVAHLVSETMRTFGETFPKSIQIRPSIAPDARPVAGDATQIQQVLMNLCVNARDAMPSGGVLEVDVSNEQIDELYAGQHPNARPGRYVRLEVCDTGEGIPRANLGRIFEPFFTTKEPGRGTGIGLSTVDGIVRDHGGFVTVESELGRGTRFRVYLPALEGSVDDASDAAPVDAPVGAGETVLVVDDESAIREITRAALEAFGYRALTAADGAEAVAVFVQYPGGIDVVVTDMAMPHMGGPATIRALRRLDPNVRIVATSGVVAEEATATALEVACFLPKPYTADTLLFALARVLGRTGTADSHG